MSGFGWAGRLVAGLATIVLLGGCGAGAKWPTPTIAPTGSSWFHPTGSMTVPRVAHTATLLSDDRVLIAGGSGYGGNLVASAELYDPATGTFSPTGSMTTERDDHTATLLSDGRVLIVGGEGYEASASAELYDPKSGTFTATGSPVTARYTHTATLLADGRVLIAGGYIVIAANASSRPTGGLVLGSAELYDPKTGKFTATGPMAAERFGHTATLLPDGHVLIAGGSKYDRSRVRRAASGAELYDPVTGAFSKTGSTTADRVGHTATLLTDGRVLIAGGSWRDGSAEVYSPKTGTFTRTGSITHPEFHTASLLSDGRVLIVGGSSYEASASAELYDPQAGTVTATGSPITARYSHTATLLSDGRVLIAGGSTYGGDLVASAELYWP